MAVRPTLTPETKLATQTVSTSHPRAGVPGPVRGTRITEAYTRMVARTTYFWAWPMVNIYNRRLAFQQVPEPSHLGGIMPVAPLNRFSMLTDYVDPTERDVACPNQDVVYGAGIVALDLSPVVVQVPEFGERFWVYQIVDLRTDSFAEIGSMYGTKPGFYLLVGRNWDGKVPNGIIKTFRATTNTGIVGPRVAQADTAADRAAVRSLIQNIDIYPLSMFDGNMKCHDWSKLPNFPKPASSGGHAETKWVFPEKFFDQIQEVLDDAPPLLGEQARYAEVFALLEALQQDSKLKAAAIDEATKAEEEVISPLLQFRSAGIPLPHNWMTITNGAAFGTDYFTRTAVAKSNILVNAPRQARYFYQDLDDNAGRLNGANRYVITFAAGALPPVKGFWSLTLYDEFHFFVPNAIQRYSVGTKNKDLRTGADGSLTIYVQADEPSDPTQRANWLPSPKNGDFSLFIRAYWPEEPIETGEWTPPPVRMC
jgi:hypothetical protein